MPKSNYLCAAILNNALRNTAFTPPATVYVALFTATPSPSGGGTEVAGNAYARVSATFNNPSGGAATANSVDVIFSTPTPSGWGTVTHFAIFDAVSAGNMLYYAALTTPQVVGAGDVVKFATGALTITES
jgi:hypothetical protein